MEESNIFKIKDDDDADYNTSFGIHSELVLLRRVLLSPTANKVKAMGANNHACTAQNYNQTCVIKDHVLMTMQL